MAICTQAGTGNVETQAGCWVLEQAALSQGCKFTGTVPPGGRHYIQERTTEDESEELALLAVAAVMVIDDGNT